MCGVFRLPSALVALVKRCAFRFLLAAVAAEFTLIYLTAGAGPAAGRFRDGLGLAAALAEIALVPGLTTGTGPPRRGGRRLGRGLLCLLLACVVGILWGLVRAKRGQQGLPWGPGIALAAWCAALFGQNLIDWYLSLL